MATESEELRSTSPKRLKLCIMDPLAPEAFEESSNSNIIQDTPDSLTSRDSAVLEGKISEQDSSTLGSVSDAGADSDADGDDSASTASSDSDVSAVSSMSGQGWKPSTCGTMKWIERLMMSGTDPRLLLNRITGSDLPNLPAGISNDELWRAISYFVSEVPRRNRLPNIKTLEDVVNLLNSCTKIMVLTGAGVSVSCGIPDFRSSHGVYARLAVDFPDLPDPQAMFDIQYFRRNPQPFFRFAKEIYPGQFKPSPCHRFIKMLEKKEKLLRNYTQNIDTLEKVAGIENVIECHGSFSTATCTKCQHKVTSEDIRKEIFEQSIPYCPICSESASATEESEKGIMKPDIVFFGEGLPEAFHESMTVDKDMCDLLIVIGSSLKVRPVALIPDSLPANVPQILINRERLPNKNFDVELLGDSDVIIDQLCHLLGEEWSELRWRPAPLTDGTHLMAARGFNTFPRTNLLGKEETEVGDSPEVKCQRIAKRVGELSESRSMAGPSDEEGTRHGSHDSSRDSGIGEASNSSVDTFLSDTTPIASYLSRGNIFFRMRKRSYVFPGAEVYNSCGTNSP